LAGSLGKFIKGDVVVVPFPFSDLSKAKNRPALVLAELGGPNLIVCAITSKSHPEEPEIKLEDADFRHGKLTSSPCYIRPDQLFTINESIISKKAGQLKEQKINAVISGLVGILQKPPTLPSPSSPALARGKRPKP
jgi:mRNA interferase MazF